MHALNHTGSLEAAIVVDLLQRTLEEQHIWEWLKQKLGNVLSNNELLVGW